MEAPSSQTHRGPGPWQGLLLAVSLSTFWIPPVTTKPTVESAPPDAAEGQDVLLLVRSLTREPLLYEWYKGAIADRNQLIASYIVPAQENSTGPAHSGRETLYANGSLLIHKVSQNDTGSYTFAVTYTNGLNDIVAGQLRVHHSLLNLKPHITSNNTNPVEDKDTVELTCAPETQDTTFLWSINSQSLPDSPRLLLSKDNRTLTIFRVTRKDMGRYLCEIRNLVSSCRSDPFTLNVLYGPDTPTILPSDTLYHPGDVLRLFCHTVSKPPAQYSWLINGTSQQHTQELVIPTISESNSGSYSCLAHNSATGLSSTALRNITISARKSLPLSAGAFAGIVIGVLVGVALTVSLGYILIHRRSERTSDKHSLSEHQLSASTPGWAPTDRSTPLDPQPDTKPADTIYQELQHPDTDTYCQINPLTQAVLRPSEITASGLAKGSETPDLRRDKS